MNFVAGNLKSEKEICEEEPVFIVEYSNGRLNLSRTDNLKYSCYKSNMNNMHHNPKRILVANSKRLCYSGSNFETDVSKITSTLLKVCIINKKDLSIKLFNADLFHLKPLLKCSDVIQKSEEKSFSEMASDLTLAFGSKIKKNKVHSNAKYNLKAKDSPDNESSFKLFQNVLEETRVIKENASVIPPQNSCAVSVDEVYDLYDIISKEEYAALDEVATTFLTCSHKTCQQWKTENKYPAFIIQYVENNTSMDLHKAKILCYLNYMFCFLNTVYTDWRKKDPVPTVPEPFKQKLMSLFTVQKSFPQRMKDKLLAHAIVLVLILNNYIFNSAVFASASKIPLSRLITVSNALGCHVSKNKIDSSCVIQLKLPLFKFRATTKRHKK